jgi:hypothetical protein
MGVNFAGDVKSYKIINYGRLLAKASSKEQAMGTVSKE